MNNFMVRCSRDYHWESKRDTKGVGQYVNRGALSTRIALTKTAPRYDRNRRRRPCQVRLAWCPDTVGEATLTPHKILNSVLVLFVLSTTKHHIFLLIKRMYRYWSAYAHVFKSCTLRVVPHLRRNQRSCWQNWRYRQCLSPMNKLQSHLQVRYVGR